MSLRMVVIPPQNHWPLWTIRLAKHSAHICYNGEPDSVKLIECLRCPVARPVGVWTCLAYGESGSSQKGLPLASPWAVNLSAVR